MYYLNYLLEQLTNLCKLSFIYCTSCCSIVTSLRDLKYKNKVLNTTLRDSVGYFGIFGTFQPWVFQRKVEIARILASMNLQVGVTVYLSLFPTILYISTCMVWFHDFWHQILILTWMDHQKFQLQDEHFSEK